MRCRQEGNTTRIKVGWVKWTGKLKSGMFTPISALRFLSRKILHRRLRSQKQWQRSSLRALTYGASWNLTVPSAFVMLLVFSPIAQADIATWYSLQSVKAEGNSGITASGEKLDELSLSCAMRSRKFGKKYRITNLKTGKSIVCRHNDFGPGKSQDRRGVKVDLTPAAFDALGGKRGYTKSGIPYGEMKISVSEVRS